MNDKPEEPYWVEVNELEGGEFFFVFVRKGLQHERGPNGSPGLVPSYNVRVRSSGESLTFQWGNGQDPGDAKQEMEEAIRQRLQARSLWMENVRQLMDQIEAWAQQLHWPSRRVEKRIDDSYVGTHLIPGIILQDDTYRILVEPVGRSAPGVDGIVDLYLMPGYDDIASLYYYDGHWNLHYMFADEEKPAATVREAKPIPLSKEALQKVFAEMKQHAAQPRVAVQDKGCRA